MSGQPKMTKMTVDEVSKLIVNKRDLYEACQRNAYYLPRYKSSMITEEWLRAIISGQAWCPHYSEIKLRPCPRPPSKDVLLNKFWDLVDENSFKMVGVDREKHVPDGKWLLDILSTFKETDRIFDKSYMPPEKKHMLKNMKTVPIPEDFVKNLPETRRKTKRKGLKLQREGLRSQRRERRRYMEKKYRDAELTEQVKEDERKQSKKRLRVSGQR